MLVTQGACAATRPPTTPARIAATTSRLSIGYPAEVHRGAQQQAGPQGPHVVVKTAQAQVVLPHRQSQHL
jgi:hypothetical protein